MIEVYSNLPRLTIYNDQDRIKEAARVLGFNLPKSTSPLKIKDAAVTPIGI